jgi:hypothetical protein
MEAGLESYADHVKQQMQASKEYAIKDPRSNQEKELAAAVIAQVLRYQKPPPVEGKFHPLVHFVMNGNGA